MSNFAEEHKGQDVLGTLEEVSIWKRKLEYDGFCVIPFKSKDFDNEIEFRVFTRNTDLKSKILVSDLFNFKEEFEYLTIKMHILDFRLKRSEIVKRISEYLDSTF